MGQKYLLAIESSCDDTSASVISKDGILSNVTHTQLNHAQYGGVVPELASRNHLQMITPVVDQALKQANISKEELNAIAVTQGPGLLGSLLVGVTFAKSMALALNIPLVAVHHMHAHILAHFIEDPKPDFPFLCLTVSGGHTQLVIVKSPVDMEIIGQTIDDAAGEAFDKTGKILGLEYPAGPIIDRLAKEGSKTIDFSKSKMEGLDFSFSGLKTSILYTLRKKQKNNPNYVKENMADICASVQSAIVDNLLSKLELAIEKYQLKEIAIAGGVSANSGLRKAIIDLAEKRNLRYYIPKLAYCTDNAAMIAQAAWYKWEEGKTENQHLVANPRLEF